MDAGHACRNTKTGRSVAVEVRNLTIPAEEVIGTLTEPLFPNQANPYAKLEKCTLKSAFFYLRMQIVAYRTFTVTFG